MVVPSVIFAAARRRKTAAVAAECWVLVLLLQCSGTGGSNQRTERIDCQGTDSATFVRWEGDRTEPGSIVQDLGMLSIASNVEVRATASFLDVDRELGCCYQIGFGAMMKPCCLSSTAQKTRGECVITPRTGGADGWAHSCPATAEEGHKWIQDTAAAFSSETTTPIPAATSVSSEKYGVYLLLSGDRSNDRPFFNYSVPDSKLEDCRDAFVEAVRKLPDVHVLRFDTSVEVLQDANGSNEVRLSSSGARLDRVLRIRRLSLNEGAANTLPSGHWKIALAVCRRVSDTPTKVHYQLQASCHATNNSSSSLAADEVASDANGLPSLRTTLKRIHHVEETLHGLSLTMRWLVGGFGAGLSSLIFFAMLTGRCRRGTRGANISQDFDLAPNPLGGNIRGNWNDDDDDVPVAGPLAGRRQAAGLSSGGAAAPNPNATAYYSLSTPR